MKRLAVLMPMIGSCIGCATTSKCALRQQLLETDREWSQAAAAGDVARVRTFWAENATNFFPGAPVAHGRKAIGELVARNRERPGFELTWQPERAVVADSGELGYTCGPFRVQFIGEGGEQVVRTGHYVCIWRREPGGRWRCEVESSVFGPEVAGH